jgi:hypothetical protein
MELELLPAVSLLPETLSVVVAPEEMLEPRVLNGNSHLQQFRIVYITGIRSGVLRLLDRNLEAKDSSSPTVSSVFIHAISWAEAGVEASRKRLQARPRCRLLQEMAR